MKKKKPVRNKPPVRRKARKAARPVVKPAGKLPKPVGRVTHFYTAIKVMIAKFSKPVRVGASVRVKGATTDFVQKIESMQYDHKPVREAKKNKLMGIKAKKRVREGDLIYPAK